MVSDLDKIKTTITLSFATKNRLRKLKGNKSYEELITQLLRVQNNFVFKESISNNSVDLAKFKRKNAVFSPYIGCKILFSYNSYSYSRNYRFDIQINFVRKDGVKLTFKKYLSELSSLEKINSLKFSYDLYFKILEFIIQEEIEPVFRHKGRFEDHYSWQSEFDFLSLSKISFEDDVLEKLTAYNEGISL